MFANVINVVFVSIYIFQLNICLPDMFENVFRARMASTSCVKQAIVEERLVRANRTRRQKQDVSELVVGKRDVEILRVPDPKVSQAAVVQQIFWRSMSTTAQPQ